MAKKKSSTTATIEADAAAPEVDASESVVTIEPQAEGLGTLADEVQSFLAQRDQLARKLREEIAATERKLADLKKTAAALFPVEPPPLEPPVKDRKPKKPATAKASKADDESSGPLFQKPSASDESAADADPAADSVSDAEAQLGASPHEPLID